MNSFELLVDWNPREQSAPSGAGELAADGPACLWLSGELLDTPSLARSCGVPDVHDAGQLLVRLYERHGLSLASRLHGPLAWVIWDPRRRRLVVARDRTGETEIFFTVSGSRIVVGSDPRSLAATLPGGPRPDLSSLARLVATMPPRPGRTYYSGVQAVQPACALVVELSGHRQVRYWFLRPLAPNGRHDVSARRVAEVLTEVAGEYVRAAARPGVALSGGFDSTSVTAAVRRATPGGRLACYSWAAAHFADVDESGCARRVAESLAFSWTAVDAAESWRSGEPLELSCATGPYRLPFAEPWRATFEAARRDGIDTILTGSGGDHLFLTARPACGLDLGMEGDWRRLSREWRRWRSGGLSCTAILRRELWKPLRWVIWPPRPDAVARASWLTPAWRRRLARRPPRPPGPPWWPPARRLQVAELTDASISGPLSYLRRLGARHGIALRHPMFDHRLQELVVSLPSWDVRRPPRMKQVLREAFPELPPCVAERRQKVSVMPLLGEALRGPLAPRVEPLLHDMRSAELGLVDERRFRDAVRSYLAGGGYAPVWDTLTVEDWLRRWV